MQDPKTKTRAASISDALEVRVRRIHRRDLNRVWEFLRAPQLD